jgi:hypothetical protein
MELEKALDQISEIHDHLARSEVYRGYRSLPIAVSGGIALAAAWIQTTLLPAEEVVSFLQYWLVIGAICGSLSSSEMLYLYLFREDSYRRQKTRRVFAQFVPCIGAGVVTTFCLMRLGTEASWLLPGLWNVFFSLGIFSCRPYLPRAIGWVGLFHLLAGAFLLWHANAGESVSPWGMGASFGTGLLLAALVHYWNIERKENV